MLPRPFWPSLIAVNKHDGPYENYWPERVSPLSIRIAFQCPEIYQVNGRQVALDADSYLLINEGTPYSHTVDTINGWETGVVFLSADLLAHVYYSLNCRSDQLLDFAPANAAAPPLNFVERLYHHDQLVTPVLRAIVAGLMRQDSAELMEVQLYLLAERLCTVHEIVRAQIEQLNFAKAGTRAEVYRRLSICHDFMLSNIAEKLPLSQIAAVAGFSPHHFLRVFRDVYKETPHQYLINVRLERARHRLRNHQRSIIDTCTELGFESASSFSSLYRRRFGVAPVQDRKGYTSQLLQPPAVS